VTVTGTGFVVGTSTTTALFGAVAATSVNCVSATSCVLVSPAHAAGQVDITLTTPGGTSSTLAADHFTYDTTPTVTALAPTAGKTAGGDSVIITGRAWRA